MTCLQVSNINVLQSKVEEGQHAISMLVECRLELARSEAEVQAWKQQVNELLEKSQKHAETRTAGMACWYPTVLPIAGMRESGSAFRSDCQVHGGDFVTMSLLQWSFCG